MFQTLPGVALSLVGVFAAGCDLLGEKHPTAPDAITVAPFSSPTNQQTVLLRGTKPAATAVVIDGEVVLPISADITFAVEAPLDEGGNVLLLQAEDALQQRSVETEVRVTRDTIAPTPPQLNAVPPRTVRTQATLTGTKPTGATIFVDGEERPETLNDATFSISMPLDLGNNRVRISTMDSVANESEIIMTNIERFDAVPFTVVPPSATVVLRNLAVEGTRAAGVVIEVETELSLVTIDGGTVDGETWSADVELPSGDSIISVRGTFEGDDQAREEDIAIHYDSRPIITVTSPVAASAVGATFALSGTIFDEAAISATWCLGTCSQASDFAPLVVGAGGDFATVIDITARGDLTDGASTQLSVRARDTDGATSTTAMSLVVSRVPSPTTIPAGTSLSLAGRGTPFSFLLAQRVGVTIVTALRDGPPVGNAVTSVATDPAAVDVSEPRVAWRGTGGALVFAEASPRTGGGVGERGLVLLPFAPNQQPELLIASTSSDISAVDVTVLSSGEFAVALVHDDVVEVAFTSGNRTVLDVAFAVSDPLAAQIGDVRIGSADDDLVTIAWLETSARDGTVDEADVVVRRADRIGVIGDPLLLSTSAGGLVDAEDTDLALAALPGATHPAAVVSVNGNDAWLFLVDGAVMAETQRQSIDASGSVQAVSAAADNGELYVALQAGAAVLLRNGPPGNLSAAVTVSTQASTQPVVTAGHVGMADSRGVVVKALEAP
jgi:hypothetical protein